jgi:hypothetical protein
VDQDGTIELSELPAASLPAWLPPAVRLYLDHVEEGTSFRAIARREGLHPSTILRQVRRFEIRREDPLMDEALAALSRMTPRASPRATFRATPLGTDNPDRKDQLMSAQPRSALVPDLTDESVLIREG